MFDPKKSATEASQYLLSKCKPPSVAVVLGSGLGAFGDTLSDCITIPYEEIPYFEPSHVKGHAGSLKVGYLPSSNTRVAAFCGRSHLYEGLSVEQIAHPTRTFSFWVGKAIVFTNAAGGINPQYTPGDLMLIQDHINLTGRNPLVGAHNNSLGARFIDMTHAYDEEIQALIQQSAASNNTKIQRGVYLSLLGPSYETPAEVRSYKVLGADAVGMSTVLEVIAARQVGLRVGGISCITNMAAGISVELLSHDEVKETASRVKSTFIELLTESLKRIAAS
ncbi:MAG: purine-nucleoside phosphorylase [Myxococcota bacterium]|nr:purine-nucleoside phosphorylase [Myxococcota bacterium]